MPSGASSISPLQGFKEHLTIISNTDIRMADAFQAQEIGGDHFRSAAAFLTQAHPKQTEGSDIYVGTSFDQLFAQHAFEGRATDLLATVGSHLVTREQQPGRALLLEAFAAARRNPEVARLLREHLIERSARMASLVDASKASGLVDPTLDTRSIVHFAHAVGLGFLLFEAIGADHPDPASWEEVVRRVVESVVPAGENPPER